MTLLLMFFIARRAIMAGCEVRRCCHLLSHIRCRSNTGKAYTCCRESVFDNIT